MREKWLVKKAGPSLAIEDMIERMLGSAFAIDEFDPARSLAQQVDGAHVLLVRSVPLTREVIDAAPHLRLIQRPGVHLEAVDLEHASVRGIPVCNVPATLTHGGEDVAEHVMFLGIGSRQKIPGSGCLARRAPHRVAQYSRSAGKSFWPGRVGADGKRRGSNGARVRHACLGGQTHRE